MLFTNQFKPTAIPGQLDLVTNPNPFVFSVRYNPADTATNTLVPGEGVVLKDLGASDAAGLPIVAKRTADTEACYGVKIFNTKQASSPVGAVVEVAGAGAIIYMTCSGAITRGSRVSLLVATPASVATLAAHYAEFGIALDKGANGDVIRVQITASSSPTA